MEYRTIKIGKFSEKFAIVCVECGNALTVMHDGDTEIIGENGIYTMTDREHRILLECDCGNKVEIE